ncbi:MAG TPA: FAD-dependent oxidoreductase [Terriglobia bacterium]|nr:FAD-dependent oxidoreductase [Terriglobia bacterium]
MEVLIIGAGVAGLAAAHALVAAGVKTQIIEARDRIGGRIWTVRSGNPAAPVELGAEFIHGRPPAFLTSQRRRGLAPCPCPQSTPM